MANAVYNNGSFDGTTIGAPFNGLPTTPQLQPLGVRFDPVKLIWLGSSNRETQITYVWHTAPVEKFEDIRKTQIVVGSQAPGTTQYDFPMVANALFGFKFKSSTGTRARRRFHLAMESGEIQGNAATNWSTVRSLNPHWVAEKKIKILAQWALRRHPELPDVPMAVDLAKTDAERQALLLLLARLEYGRPYFLPPGVPAERVNALRRAFDATMKDKEFLADAQKISLDVDPLLASRSPHWSSRWHALRRRPPRASAPRSRRSRFAFRMARPVGWVSADEPHRAGAASEPRVTQH